MPSVMQQALLGAVATAPATIAFQGLTTASVFAGNICTATACPIGTPSGRTVFCIVHWSNSTAARALLNATIGGVAATIHAQNNSLYGTFFSGTAIISAVVPTGTTADVVGTFATGSGASYSMWVASYSVTNLVSQTPGGTFSAAASGFQTHSDTIDVVKDGILIVGYSPFWDTTTTLTGVTRDYNVVVNVGSGWAITGGSLEITADQTGRTITLSVPSSSTNSTFVGAAFR